MSDYRGRCQPGMIQEIEIRPVVGMRAMRLMRGFLRRGAQKHGHEHQSRAVCRGHQERPECEIAKANPHPHPAGMPCSNKTIDSETDEYDRGGQTQCGVRDG